MKSKTSQFVALLVLVVIPISALVGSRLRWSVSPNFLWAELDGVVQLEQISLGDLCSPRILAGIEGQTSNVASMRSTSLLYAVPTKLLRHRIDVLTLHRILGVIFFLAGLAFLAAALVRLGLDPVLIACGLVYYGLSAQYVSLLFDELLTITSTFWLALATFVFSSLCGSSQRGARKSLLWMLLVPPTAALAYETYAVGRPLAVAYVAFVLVWAALQTGWKRKLALLGCGALGCGLAFLALRAVHPHMRFDLSLFEGKSESIVDAGGRFKDSAEIAVRERLGELHSVLDWPDRRGFTSRTPSECGWRDIWIALVTLVGLLLLTTWSRRWKRVREEACRLYWPGALLVGLGVASLLIPIGSVTYVRGHRFFGLYMTSVALAVLLGHLLIASGSRLLRGSLRVAAVTGVVAIIWLRVPAIAQWPLEHRDFTVNVRAVTQQLRSIVPPPGTVIDPGGVHLIIGDSEGLAGAQRLVPFYVSDFACRFHIKDITWDYPLYLHEACHAPDESHTKIFRVFMRYTPEGGGTGLVLTYCARS